MSELSFSVFLFAHILICLSSSTHWSDDMFANSILFPISNRKLGTGCLFVDFS